MERTEININQVEDQVNRLSYNGPEGEIWFKILNTGKEKGVYY